MKTMYVCKICGFASHEREAVLKCESQGNISKYHVGQKVKFRYAPRGVDWEVVGEIVEVKFREQTHDVGYAILVGDEPRFEISARNCVHDCIGLAVIGLVT